MTTAKRATTGRFTSGKLLLMQYSGYMIQLNHAFFTTEELAVDLDHRRWPHGLRFVFDHDEKRGVAYIA